MANWWDEMGTTIGDNLIGMQMPFGMAPPTDPQQRAQMINPMLMQIGASMLANRKKDPVVNLGNALTGAQAMGQQNMGRQLYAAQLSQAAEDRKEKKEQENKTRQWALKQPWAKDYPVATMDAADLAKLAMSVNKQPDMPGSYDEFRLAQQNPAYAQYLQQGKGAGPSMQTREIDGVVYNWNPQTGQLGEALGKASSRGQSVPQAVQGDAIRTEQSFKNVTQALDRFEKLAKNAGVLGSTVPGAKRDAIEQERRNIQLQLKELFNLGVLNGPDLSLMEQMIFDPSISVTDPIGSAVKTWGGVDDRIESSVSKLKEMLKTVRDNKLAVVKSYSGGGGATPTQGPPPEIDPALWDVMTPEEQALWQTSQ